MLRIYLPNLNYITRGSQERGKEVKNIGKKVRKGQCAYIASSSARGSRRGE
jgi:hypothetical protein